MLGLWDCFTPVLTEAVRIVWHRLPTVANALHTMFPFLVSDLNLTVSKATCGPSLDPTQSAKETASKLNYMCTHVHNLNEKLEEINWIGQNLQGINPGYRSFIDASCCSNHREQLARMMIISEYNVLFAPFRTYSGSDLFGPEYSEDHSL